jgi:hypothetical protein
MPTCKSTPPPGLWLFAQRDRTIFLAWRHGVSLSILSRLHGLSALRVTLIIRKVWAHEAPADWVDAAGLSLAWSRPLTELRRAAYGGTSV